MAMVLKGEIVDILTKWNELERKVILKELAANINMAYVFDDYDLAYMLEKISKESILTLSGIKDKVESAFDVTVMYSSPECEIHYNQYAGTYFSTFRGEQYQIQIVPNWLL